MRYEHELREWASITRMNFELVAEMKRAPKVGAQIRVIRIIRDYLFCVIIF